MMENDEQEVLTEGEDYYFEDGLMVLTARYSCVVVTVVSRGVEIARMGSSRETKRKSVNIAVNRITGFARLTR